MTGNVEELTDMAAAMSHDPEVIRNIAEEFNAAFNALLNENALSRRQLDERAGRIAELDESLQQASCSLQEAVDRGRQLEQDLTGQAENLARQLQEMTAERDRLQEQVENQRETIAGQERELADLKAGHEEVSGQLATLGEEHRQVCAAREEEQAALERQLDAARDSLATTEQQLQDSRERETGYQDELSGSQAAMEELKCENARLQQDAEARERKFTDQQAALDKSRSDLQSMGEAYRELEEHAQNLEKLNQALHDSSASEQNKSRKAIELRDKELADLHGRLEALGEAREDSELLAGEVQELQVKLADAEHQLCQMADLQVALRQAQEKLSGQDAVMQETAGLHSEIERLQGELAAVPERSATGVEQNGIAALEAENSRLRAELQALADQSGGAIPARGGEPADPAQEPMEQQPTRPDRAGFTAALEAVLGTEQQPGRMAAAVYLQVDDFGQIREETGVADCERIVGQLHELLESCCDADDQLARFGDSAFAILLYAQDTDAVRQRAEEMREAVEDRILETGTCTVVATVSVGVVPIEAGDAAANEVLSHAIQAGEAASSRGGNQVMLHPCGEAAGAAPAVFGNDADIVSTVLRENRIRTFYQPISNLKGDASGYYEVLVRIQGDDENEIAPGEFFAMAGRSGRSSEVDYRVIETAVKVLAEEKEQGTTLFVKLSPGTIGDQELGMRIMKLLKANRIEPGRMVFEIAENNLRQDLRNVSALSRALHSIGCKVAIEHYTMSTQAQHLKHIHVDYLKIDASLVQDAGDNEDKVTRIKAIIDIARANQCRTIAEQVESPYSLTRLWSLGVDYAQGYFIQEPGAERGYDFGGTDSGAERDGGGKAVFDID